MSEDTKCETCHREFGTQEAAVRHMDILAHWDTRFKCSTCDKKFFTQRAADQHMYDTGHRKPQVQCETCDKRFHTQRSADNHMSAKKHRKPQFKVETCDEGFGSQLSAIQHREAPSNYERHNYHDRSQKFQGGNFSNIDLGSSIQRGKNVARPKQQMYPNLHQSIVNALAGHMIPVKFHNNDSDRGSTDKYSTFVMGAFTCENNACHGGAWYSGKVAIYIRKYPVHGYNAVVYGQSCKRCKKLGRLDMDEESYVDRVTFRLKKWAGVETEQRIFEKKQTPPHRSDLCEGCKLGVCGETNKYDYMRLL